jgi:hypothetical protein
VRKIQQKFNVKIKSWDIYNFALVLTAEVLYVLEVVTCRHGITFYGFDESFLFFPILSREEMEFVIKCYSFKEGK